MVSWIKLAAAGAAGAGVWMLAGAANAASSYMVCQSYGKERSYCRAQTGIASVTLHRRYSSAPCRYGNGWGHDRNGIWVAGGCRAQFLVVHVSSRGYRDRDDYDDYRRGGGYDKRRDYDWDDDYRRKGRGGYDYDDDYSKKRGREYGGKYRNISRSEAVNICTDYARRQIRHDGGRKPRIEGVYRTRQLDHDSWRIRGTASGRFYRGRRDCDFVCSTDGYRVTRFRFN